MLHWRKMNFGLLLLAVALLHVNSCPQNQFQLPDRICCDFCEEGRYVAINCTRSGSRFIGVRCLPCSVCANGTQMVASCTMFSNTQCTQTELFTEIEETFTKAPPIKPETADEPLTVHMALYVIVPLVLLVIVTLIGYKLCSRRSTSRDPAEEPLKTMV